MRIDLNCDMGESFGRHKLGLDEEIIQFITSANIACGFHSGDPIWMGKTVALADKFNVSIGAHPSFPDLVGFGRRKMELSDEELTTTLIYQIGALKAFLKTQKQLLKCHFLVQILVRILIVEESSCFFVLLNNDHIRAESSWFFFWNS